MDVRIEDVLVDDPGPMPTGSGEPVVSVSSARRKRLRKEAGETVDITVLRKLT